MSTLPVPVAVITLFVRFSLNVISATLLGLFGVSFAPKKVMEPISALLTGIAGGLKLYSGVKGMFGDNSAKRLLDKSRASEEAWYKRNYYNDYLNNSMSRAAIKRVEDTLSRNSRQNRAYAAINGVTPEYTLAANGQGLTSMENVLNNLAARESERRMSVDAQHQQNVNNLNSQQLTWQNNIARQADSDLMGGLSLIASAVDGVNWGKEGSAVPNNNLQQKK